MPLPPRIPFPLSVRVTRDDLASGERGDAFRCPVATAVGRAIREAGGGERKVDAQLSRIGIPGEGALPLPEEVADRIRRIDRGEPVGPFSFSLRRKASPSAKATSPVRLSREAGYLWLKSPPFIRGFP